MDALWLLAEAIEFSSMPAELELSRKLLAPLPAGEAPPTDLHNNIVCYAPQMYHCKTRLIDWFDRPPCTEASDVSGKRCSFLTARVG